MLPFWIETHYIYLKTRSKRIMEFQILATLLDLTIKEVLCQVEVLEAH